MSRKSLLETEIKNSLATNTVTSLQAILFVDILLPSEHFIIEGNAWTPRRENDHTTRGLTRTELYHYELTLKELEITFPTTPENFINWGTQPGNEAGIKETFTAAYIGKDHGKILLDLSDVRIDQCCPGQASYKQFINIQIKDLIASGFQPSLQNIEKQLRKTCGPGMEIESFKDRDRKVLVARESGVSQLIKLETIHAHINKCLKNLADAVKSELNHSFEFRPRK